MDSMYPTSYYTFPKRTKETIKVGQLWDHTQDYQLPLRMRGNEVANSSTGWHKHQTHQKVWLQAATHPGSYMNTMLYHCYIANDSIVLLLVLWQSYPCLFFWFMYCSSCAFLGYPVVGSCRGNLLIHSADLTIAVKRSVYSCCSRTMWTLLHALCVILVARVA